MSGLCPPLQPFDANSFPLDPGVRLWRPALAPVRPSPWPTWCCGW